MSGPVIVLAFDSLDKDLVAQLSAQGQMPHFGRILASGLVGDIEGVPGFYIGTSWISFQTGLSPARHGCHYVEQIELGTYKPRRIPRALRCKSDPFWQFLSDAGKRVAILDVPHTRVIPGLNGIQLVEWGTHDHDHAEVQSWPPSLASELIARFGSHPLPGSCDGDRDPAGLARLRDDFLAGIRAKTEMTVELLGRERWDLLVQVFPEAHCAGHQCWHLHETRHPRHAEVAAPGLGDPVVDVYKALDQALGRILDSVDPKATVLVLGNLGMASSCSPSFLADEILARLGVVKTAQTSPAQESSRQGWQGVDGWLTQVWQRLPRRVRGAVMPARDVLRGALDQRMHPPRVYPSGGQCFRLAADHRHLAIRVNLAGREPRGTVQPGTDYDRFCSELENDLRDIVNLDSGNSIVERVVRTRDHDSGPFLDHLPDLLVEYRRDSPVTGVRSNKIGEIRRQPPRYRTGNHKPDGMFAVLGPWVRPSRLEQPVSMMDFAPTICRMLGVELPAANGSVLTELSDPYANTK